MSERRLIDLDNLLRDLEEQLPMNWTNSDYETGEEFGYEQALNIVKEQPTIDPVKHGEWLNDSGYDDWHCSECGFEINYDGEYPTEYDNFRFCGCCGAEMGGEKIWQRKK